MSPEDAQRIADAIYWTKLTNDAKAGGIVIVAAIVFCLIQAWWKR